MSTGHENPADFGKGGVRVDQVFDQFEHDDDVDTGGGQGQAGPSTDA